MAIKKRYVNLKKGLVFFVAHKKDLIFVFVFAIFCGLLPLALPVLEGVFLASILDKPIDAIYLAGWLFGVAFIAEIAFFLLNLFYAKLVTKVIVDIKFKIVSALPKIKTRVLDSTSTGAFTTRINKDTEDLARAFVSAISSLVSVVSNVMFLAFVFFVNFWLGLYTFGCIVVLFLVESIRIGSWKKGREKILSQLEVTEGATNEIVLGAKEVKILGQNEFTLKKVSIELNKQRRVTFVETVKQNTFIHASASFSVLLSFVFVFIGINFVIAGALSVSAFLVVYVYRTKTNTFLADVVDLKGKLAEGELSAERIFQIVCGYKRFSHEEFGKIEKTKIKGKISFSNVTFAYSRKKPILKNVNFVIQPKTTVAFVGKSGVGKSTLLSLVARLVDPVNGQVKIDETDAREFSEKSIRSMVSFVMEEPFVFGGTIKENLLCSNPFATFEEIVAACKIAQIHDFISSKTRGYDTEITEKGFVLSAGERQRLALARAILKKSKILLLDEPTKSLDVFNQLLISKALRKVAKKHTVVLTTHSDKVVAFCDKVFEIKQGKIFARKKNLSKIV